MAVSKKRKLEIWETWEDEFLRATYHSRKWSPAKIAEKLERTRLSVYRRANDFGLKRPAKRLNYKKIKRLHLKGLSMYEIASAAACSHSGVHKAIHTMKQKGEL